jgi:radical SAM protein with 4Fe4S-binding SPASM domain
MDCPHIPIELGSEFTNRLLEASNERLAVLGSIEVTTRCNLRCVHCYINTPVNDASALKSELSFRDLRNIIDQIVGEGCLWLLMTGGEPFVRDDFLDAYVYARKKGLLVTVFTNGTLLTPRLADRLAEFSPSLVEITLYGRSQQTFEVVTGVPGSYSRCMKAIELLMERKINLGLKTMVSRLNSHEVWAMQEYAKQLGIGFRFDAMINARLDGALTPIIHRIPEENAVAFDLADKERAEIIRKFCDTLTLRSFLPDRLFQCGAGRDMFHIDSNGRLSPCLMLRQPAWDLNALSFREAWHELVPTIFDRTRQNQTQCISCKLFALCDQCPGWGLLEHGDPETPVDYLCRVAHLRAKLFMQPKLSTGG